MAIDAKMSFLRQVEKNLADKMTVTGMANLMSELNDILEGFEMREIVRWDPDAPDDMLDSYIDALTVQGKSPNTLRAYKYQIARLMEFTKVHTRKINVYHIRSYLMREKERGVSDGTLKHIREVLSAYFGWLHREGLIEKNPIANVGPIKVAKKNKMVYTEVDLEKLNENCKTLRDKAIMHFLGSTGCRISEMTGLNRNQIDFANLECVVHGKGNKERTVFLDPVTGMLLKSYLESRTDDNEALFIGRRNTRFQPGGVRVMMHNVEKLAGVKHVHPHKFRRTLATGLSRRGMPVQEIANILGHEKLDTTMQYVMLNKDDIKTSYRKYA